MRLIQSPAEGGYGLDAQWNDDFHHALHSILTGETNGYYQDFGRLDHLVKALTDKFVMTAPIPVSGNGAMGIARKLCRLKNSWCAPRIMIRWATA
jgi:1,4-alpha-glucan branching enzyme